MGGFKVVVAWDTTVLPEDGKYCQGIGTCTSWRGANCCTLFFLWNTSVKYSTVLCIYVSPIDVHTITDLFDVQVRARLAGLIHGSTRRSNAPHVPAHWPRQPRDPRTKE